MGATNVAGLICGLVYLIFKSMDETIIMLRELFFTQKKKFLNLRNPIYQIFIDNISIFEVRNQQIKEASAWYMNRKENQL